MSIFQSDLCIEIRIPEYNESKKIIRVLRAYSNSSVSTLLKELKNEEAVFRAELIKTSFYSGWENFYNLVQELKQNNVSIELRVNEKDLDLSFAEDLKGLVKGIKREDIY
ncbi:MAG: hypothetical protein D6B27_08410 [Gammaproteobacteria bacterium]|nr:MAG: hypothetical protein D6B27_08410 [Gammaproteobacteria bacterium]